MRLIFVAPNTFTLKTDINVVKDDVNTTFSVPNEYDTLLKALVSLAYEHNVYEIVCKGNMITKEAIKEVEQAIYGENKIIVWE